jgi:iron(III) transport system permease protein
MEATEIDRGSLVRQNAGKAPLIGRTSKWRPSSFWATLLFLASVLALLFFVALPLGGIAWQSFRAVDGTYTLANYAAFLESSRLYRATLNTLLVSTLAAVGGILVATPLAFGVTRTNMRGKQLVYAAIVISFASPGFLMTLGYILLAGPNEGLANVLLRALFNLEMTRGPLNILSVWGFAFLTVPGAAALAFLIMVPAFQNMDSALEEASRIAGVGPIATIFKITLPVMRASMLAGALLAFSTTLADFATPYLLGVDVLTVSMQAAILSADFGMAATLAAISASMSLLVLFLYRRSIATGLRYRTIAGRGLRVGNLELGWARHFFTALGFVYAMLGAILPSILLVLISFMDLIRNGFWPSNFTLKHYEFIFGNQMVVDAIQNSLILGVAAATVIALLGFLLAYLITRTTIPGRALIDYLSILPLGIAGVAFGVGAVIINLETPLRNLALYGTVWILLFGYIGRYIPFGVRAAQVALLQLSSEMEEASRVAGRGQLATLWRISLPLVRPALVYSWIFGFVQAFTEVSVSSVLTVSQNPVTATALLSLYYSQQGLQRACAVGVVMFIITMSLVALAQRIGGRNVYADT